MVQGGSERLIQKEYSMPDRVVYSTDSGRVTNCSTCGQPYKHCRCEQPTSTSKKSAGFVRLMRDRKGRAGKTVTVITDVPGDDIALSTLAQQLKKLCGSGGTLKDRTIEI